MVNTKISSPLERASEISIPTTSYEPMRIMEIELAEELPVLSALNEQTGQRYRRVCCVVRLHTQPLGTVELSFLEDTLEPDQYAGHIWEKLHQQINAHLYSDGLPSVSALSAAGLPCTLPPACITAREKFYAQAPFVSVIVATHNRPDRLQRCLRSLLALHYPSYEIVIVDNAPSTTETYELIARYQQSEPHLHYVCEKHKGASRARNCGSMAAKGDILVFTDDDVVVDQFWLLELVRAFQVSDRVACVTGLILPMELETQAQIWFEQFGGFTKGFTRSIFDLYKHHPKTPVFPYYAGKFGTGASFALTAGFLEEIGGFDTALGPGTPSQGGEDLAIFFQVVKNGYTLVYEPAALIYHQHRRSYTELCRQIYTYGSGLTAYLTKVMLDKPANFTEFLAQMPYVCIRFLAERLTINHKDKQSTDNQATSAQYPKDLLQLEMKGMLYGPLAYFQGHRTIYRAQDSSRKKMIQHFSFSRGKMAQ